jgi:hypothetical protein
VLLRPDLVHRFYRDQQTPLRQQRQRSLAAASSARLAQRWTRCSDGAIAMNHPLRPFREAYASQNQRPKPAVAAVAYRYCNCGPVLHWASTQRLSAADRSSHADHSQRHTCTGSQRAGKQTCGSAAAETRRGALRDLAVYAARCMWSVECCALHVECCVLHVEC